MRGILETKTFWATDVRFMNDRTEGTYAYDAVRDALSSRNDILSAELRYIFDKHGSIPGAGTDWFRYAVCLCGTTDLLSQWVGYTRKEEGVALVIPSSALIPRAGRAFALIRVLYEPKHQIEKINSFLDHAVGVWSAFAPETKQEADAFLGIVGYVLIQLMLRFKNPKFEKENEWRVLLIALAREKTERVRYRCRNGQEIPYIDVPFHADYLSQVLI